MSTNDKNNIFIANHVYINEYNNKNRIFITNHAYILSHANHYFTYYKIENRKFQTVREEVSLRTH